MSNIKTIKYLFFKTTNYIFIIRIIGALISLISSIIIARVIGIDDAGRYFLSLSIIAITASLSSLGFNNLILKHCSSGDKTNNLKSNIFIYSTKKIFLSTLTGAIILLFLLPIFTEDCKINNFNYILGFSIIISTLNIIFTAYLQSQKKITLSVITQYIIQPSLLTFALILTPLIFSSVGYNFAIYYYLISILITFIIYSCVISQKISFKSYKNENFSFIKNEKRDYFISNSLGMLITQSYILISGLFLTSSDIAIVAISEKLTLVVNLFSISIITLVSPQISKYFSLREHGKVKSIVQKSVISISIIGLLICTFFLIFGDHILLLFGNDFSKGINVLFIFMLSQVINSIFSPAYALLNMTGEQSFLSKLHLYMAIPSVVITLVMTYFFKIEGLAISKLLVIILINIIPAIYIKRKFGYWI
ncbi:oligosaccharide flippase family protein [Xenorhabdus bovienii]|uniref:oligosaccharide flippase family protein n=1 Tax=Xenorhabdus bovienii TaxID=40576 RepID=UPI0023B3381B|nr:oligosaccharide flippase family protein [Xenorhabdus bovienii]MDE9453842.1 oligosaccharide flippase family protein [Xenorhabdus bovienii]